MKHIDPVTVAAWLMLLLCALLTAFVLVVSVTAVVLYVQDLRQR